MQEQELARGLLRHMMRIRISEETLAVLYKDEQQMRTPTHFSIGQEAVAVGVCDALELTDAVYSGHRCHAHYLAKGGDLLGMVAELYGKEIGCAHGRGGSVHLNDASVGFIASSAILGETIAAATGSAWAFQMDGSPRIAVAFFGDGATEEGIFHETMNFAAVKHLPVLFACENNMYSTHTHIRVRQPEGIGIWERVSRAYGIEAQHVDGYDVFAVNEAAQKAAAWCRAGKGPYFLECATYRWREHVGPLWDWDWGYRTKDEVDEWVARDSIKQAEERLITRGFATADEIDSWRSELQKDIDEAIAVAKAAAFPPVEDLFVGTY